MFRIRKTYRIFRAEVTKKIRRTLIYKNDETKYSIERLELMPSSWCERIYSMYYPFSFILTKREHDKICVDSAQIFQKSSFLIRHFEILARYCHLNHLRYTSNIVKVFSCFYLIKILLLYFMTILFIADT